MVPFEIPTRCIASSMTPNCIAGTEENKALKLPQIVLTALIITAFIDPHFCTSIIQNKNYS